MFLGKFLPARLKAAVKRVLWRSLSLSWKTVSGCSICILDYSDWCMFMDIFVDGEYDLAIQDTIARAPRDETIVVLDLGANVGFFLLRFLDLLHKSGRTDLRVKFFAIDGSRKALGRIRPQLPAASHRHEIAIIRGLAGKREGSETFYNSSFSCAGNIFESKQEGSESIDYVDLEKLVPAPRQIDLLKCDIEGAELLLATHYPELLARVDRMVVELHHTMTDVNKTRQLLAGTGLEQSRVVRQSKWFEVLYLTRPKPGSTHQTANPFRSARKQATA